MSDSQFDSTIPVLDLQNYRNEATRMQFVEDLRHAFAEVGFIALTNVNVDKKTLDEGYAAAERFFRLDEATKMEINDSRLNGQRGFVLSESAKGEDRKDFKEFLSVGREMSDADHERLKIYKNLWPTSMELKAPMRALYDALEVHKSDLEEAMSLALGRDKDFISNMTREGDCLLRSIYYPAECPNEQVWAAEHTDIDLYTILPRATADGLQVKNKDGKWIDVRTPENAIVINAGDMLQNLSNGEFRSSVHRVVDQGKREERFSMVFFVHPRNSDMISPLPEAIERTGGVRKYAEATAWEILEERLADLGLANDEMLQHLGSCGVMERLLEVGRASSDAMQALRKAGYASPAVLNELEKSVS